MSHIYQPVFIKALLENNGSISASKVAKDILSYDSSQIEYYEDITRKMPAEVLKKRGIIKGTAKAYELSDEFNSLTVSEARLLISYCDKRLAEYLLDNGDKPFYHRKRASGVLSGSVKYEVLRKAKSKCELCGISNNEKALEVDHIIPRNKGGSDDISNLQALCYSCNSCNSMKRDADDTDFREVLVSYNLRKDNCLFCKIPKERIIDENELAYVIEDGFPVTKKHSLVIPKRHVSSYFDPGKPEINACNMLLEKTKDRIQSKDSSVTGFNIGINIGEDAGQTIFHCHIHLIPRRAGDTENPKGGVRGVVPSKQSY